MHLDLASSLSTCTCFCCRLASKMLIFLRSCTSSVASDSCCSNNAISARSSFIRSFDIALSCSRTVDSAAAMLSSYSLAQYCTSFSSSSTSVILVLLSVFGLKVTEPLASIFSVTRRPSSVECFWSSSLKVLLSISFSSDKKWRRLSICWTLLCMISISSIWCRSWLHISDETVGWKQPSLFTTPSSVGIVGPHTRSPDILSSVTPLLQSLSLLWPASFLDPGSTTTFLRVTSSCDVTALSTGLIVFRVESSPWLKRQSLTSCSIWKQSRAFINSF